MGKNVVMKIRKMAGASPIPNQRIAKGIQASGERLRKKLTIGSSALRARTRVPSHSPAGTPSRIANVNPVPTRKSDATMSVAKRPVEASSISPFTTVHGAGKAEEGKTPLQASSPHIARKMSAVPHGAHDLLDASLSTVKLLPWLRLALQAGIALSCEGVWQLEVRKPWNEVRNSGISTCRLTNMVAAENRVSLESGFYHFCLSRDCQPPASHGTRWTGPDRPGSERGTTPRTDPDRSIACAHNLARPSAAHAPDQLPRSSRQARAGRRSSWSVGPDPAHRVGVPVAPSGRRARRIPSRRRRATSPAPRDRSPFSRAVDGPRRRHPIPARWTTARVLRWDAHGSHDSRRSWWDRTGRARSRPCSR